MVLPLATFLALARLESGLTAFAGIGITAGVAAVATAGAMLFDPTGIGLAVGLMFIAATALAGIAQLVRQALGNAQAPWVYPSVVGATLLTGGFFAVKLLGY